MAKRKNISKKTRFEVFKRDSFACQYCGASAPTTVLRIDHIQPVSKDGDNDLLNLITSCFDCNAGKSDRLLSDDSAVTKQKAQLDELNVRREQLEMMLQWRNGLQDLRESEVDTASDEWSTLTKSYSLTDHGKESVRKLIKKFGLIPVLDAMDVSTQYFELNRDGAYTQESVDNALSKVGGICKNATLPEWQQELNHIKNIARKNWAYCSEWRLMDAMKELHLGGVEIDRIRTAVLTSRNWSTGMERLDYLRDGGENGES